MTSSTSSLSLPEDVATACASLFAVLPLNEAMGRLLGSHPKYTDLVNAALLHPALMGQPALAAGLWLYVDDLDRSHVVSQSINDTTGSYWHGIMHRREGDFSNSRYWMRRAANHPLLQSNTALAPEALIDLAAAAKGQDLPDLVELQRAEWLTLFEWCATHLS